jgi:hypothetical protein
MPPSRSTLSDSQRKEFQELADQLSPENLSSDGETRKGVVANRARQLHAAWTALEARVGHKVAISEVEPA